MHLVIDTLDWPTPRQRLKRSLQLDFCIVLTRGQRLARAFFWACVGSALTSIGIAFLSLTSPVPPVKALDPEVVYASDAYTVYRLRFAWRSSEKACEFTVFHDRPITWSLQCAPR